MEQLGDISLFRSNIFHKAAIILKTLITDNMNLCTLFKTIDEKNRSLFIARALRFTNCIETARDIVQNVYVELIEKLSKENKKNTTESALTRLVLQYVEWRGIDCYKKQQRKPEIHFPNICNEEVNPVVLQINKTITKDFSLKNHKADSKVKLEQILRKAKLSVLEKLVFRMTLEGWKVAEIAEKLGLEPRQITNCKHKLFLKLRKLAIESAKVRLQ